MFLQKRLRTIAVLVAVIYGCTASGADASVFKNPAVAQTLATKQDDEHLISRYVTAVTGDNAVLDAAPNDEQETVTDKETYPRETYAVLAVVGTLFGLLLGWVWGILIYLTGHINNTNIKENHPKIVRVVNAGIGALSGAWWYYRYLLPIAKNYSVQELAIFFVLMIVTIFISLPVHELGHYIAGKYAGIDMEYGFFQVNLYDEKQLDNLPNGSYLLFMGLGAIAQILFGCALLLLPLAENIRFALSMIIIGSGLLNFLPLIAVRQHDYVAYDGLRIYRHIGEILHNKRKKHLKTTAVNTGKGGNSLVNNNAINEEEVSRVTRAYTLNEDYVRNAVKNGWTYERLRKLEAMERTLSARFEALFGINNNFTFVFRPLTYDRIATVNRPERSFVLLNLAALPYTTAYETINNWFLEEWIHTVQRPLLGDFAAFPEILPAEGRAFFSQLSTTGFPAPEDVRFSILPFDARRFQSNVPANVLSTNMITIVQELFEIRAAALGWMLSQWWTPKEPSSETFDRRSVYWEDAVHAVPEARGKTVPFLASVAARFEGVLAYDTETPFLPKQVRTAMKKAVRRYTREATGRNRMLFLRLKDAYKNYFFETLAPFDVTARYSPYAPHITEATIMHEHGIFRAA